MTDLALDTGDTLVNGLRPPVRLIRAQVATRKITTCDSQCILRIVTKTCYRLRKIGVSWVVWAVMPGPARGPCGAILWVGNTCSDGSCETALPARIAEVSGAFDTVVACRARRKGLLRRRVIDRAVFTISTSHWRCSACWTSMLIRASLRCYSSLAWTVVACCAFFAALLSS